MRPGPSNYKIFLFENLKFLGFLIRFPNDKNPILE